MKNEESNTAHSNNVDNLVGAAVLGPPELPAPTIFMHCGRDIDSATAQFEQPNRSPR